MSSEVAKVALTLQNKHRTDHGSPPLEWDGELEKSANDNAQSLVHNPDAPFVLNKGGDGSQGLLGYNIFEMEAEGQLTDEEIVEHAVRCWYDDGANYNPESGKGGSYSQLLWKSSVRMALGVARKLDEVTGLLTAVAFAFYDPPGNFSGQFEENVAPLREEKKKAVIKSAKIGSGTAKPRPIPKPAPISNDGGQQPADTYLDDADTTRSVVQGSATEIRDIASAILDMVNATVQERKLDPSASANKITTITATITGGPSSDDGSRLQAALRGALASTGITDLTVTTGPSSDDPDNDQVTETSITVTITNDMVLGGGLAVLPPMPAPVPEEVQTTAQTVGPPAGAEKSEKIDTPSGQEVKKEEGVAAAPKEISDNKQTMAAEQAAEILKKSDEAPSTNATAAVNEKPVTAAELKEETKDKTAAAEPAKTQPPSSGSAAGAEPASPPAAVAAAVEPPPKMEIKFKVRVGVLSQEMKELSAAVQNELRGKHGAPSLKIDQKLCDEAQAHAKSILANKSPEDAGKEKSSAGINVYEVTGSLTEPEEGIRAAVAHWYSKVSGHNWADPMASSQESQIFSQVVWASSRRLGVAVEADSTNSVVVMVYAPPADFSTVKLYRSNVRPDVF